MNGCKLIIVCVFYYYCVVFVIYVGKGVGVLKCIIVDGILVCSSFVGCGNDYLIIIYVMVKWIGMGESSC